MNDDQCNEPKNKFLVRTVQKFKKTYLFFLCSPRLILTRSPQISRQNMSLCQRTGRTGQNNLLYRP